MLGDDWREAGDGRCVGLINVKNSDNGACKGDDTKERAEGVPPEQTGGGEQPIYLSGCRKPSSQR